MAETVTLENVARDIGQVRDVHRTAGATALFERVHLSTEDAVPAPTRPRPSAVSSDETQET